MLYLEVWSEELFDEQTNKFLPGEKYVLALEHCLAAVSKWESIWGKPFLTDKPKTLEEILSYFVCMSMDEKTDPKAFTYLNPEHVKRISEYMERRMTATTFSDNPKPSRQIVTAEVLYHRMLANGIPLECQYWHLNKLLTLLHVYAIENEPEKKLSPREIAARNRALNEIQKKRLKTKG